MTYKLSYRRSENNKMIVCFALNSENYECIAAEGIDFDDAKENAIKKIKQSAILKEETIDL